MKRIMMGTMALVLATSATARAHFVFVTPDAAGNTARVFLSETLTPDQSIPTTYVASAKLSLRDAAGQEHALTLQNGAHFMITRLPGANGIRLVHGQDNLGVTQRDADHPYDLIYFPKTILGDPFDAKAIVGGDAPVELIPVGNARAFTLKFVANGQPLADADVTVLLPDGSSKVLTTHTDGTTDALMQPGQYGAWARHFVKASGERDGKKFEEVREYATLVFTSKNAPQPPVQQATTAPADLFATMPQAASSFGAVASDGYLYLYGGHIAPTHTYSTQAVSGQFHRLKLTENPHDRIWETLPAGPPMQGMNLAASGGKIYRIGGMEPTNKPGEPENTRSLDTCAFFDPATRQWSPLPPLPAPRSSHDVVAINHTLIVVGGWNLVGDQQNWQDSLLTLDLSNPHAAWQSHPQPFHRRALIAAAYQNKLYVIGGFDENEQVVNRVDIFDPHTDQWTAGPALPAKGFAAFGPAACALDGQLYVSLGDGSLNRLEGDTWVQVGHATPRLVHRIAPFNHDILVIGGATMTSGNLASIERVTPAAPGQRITAPVGDHQ
ncbi:MAG TPA: kelch repeat-containing protein [Phycisphaerae bacterium]|nr:kelch repeat-containing protein [Phycisphaerae bacterium]